MDKIDLVGGDVATFDGCVFHVGPDDEDLQIPLDPEDVDLLAAFKARVMAAVSTVRPTEGGNYWVRVNGKWGRYFYDVSNPIWLWCQDMEHGIAMNAEYFTPDILWGCRHEIACPYQDDPKLVAANE